MSKMPSPSMAVSIVALVISLGGAGYSATGGNFILGRANNADAQTRLTSAIDGGTLQLVNTGTGSNASALRLTVEDGKEPLMVNSDALVPNLNADKLDGLGAAQLLRVGLGEPESIENGTTSVEAAKIRMQIPQPGFVLVTGTVTAVTTNAECDPCYFHAVLTDKTTGAVSPGMVESIGNGDTDTRESVISGSWVFPVQEAGPRTFALRTGIFPLDADVGMSNPTITALYVPFGATGSGPPPPTKAKGTP